jgi:hypothetical protein
MVWSRSHTPTTSTSKPTTSTTRQVDDVSGHVAKEWAKCSFARPWNYLH